MGGWVGERIEDLGKSVEKIVVDPIKDFGSSLEDAVRDAADDVNKVIENPYVQAAVSIWNPAAGAVLSSYATLNSGDELSPAQIAALATAGYSVGSGVKLSPEITKAIDAGVAVAEGGDIQDVLISTYGGDFAKELGLDTKVKSGLEGFVGSDFVNRINENIDINQAAADFAAGNSPERILANQFGDEVVGYLGADTPTQQAFGFAGIESLVSKAEGASDEDALLAGAKTYYDRGGRLPDINTIASVAGFEDFDFDYNNLLSDLNLDFPDLNAMGYDLPSLSSLGINLGGLNFEGFKPIDLGFDLSQLPQIADLGIDLGQLDLSGVKFDDLNLGFNELADLGIDVGDVDFDFDLRNLPFGGLGTQESPIGLEGLAVAQATEEEDQLAEDQLDIPQLLLADFQLKNPLLKG